MDVYVTTGMERMQEILEQCGFVVKRRERKVYAVMEERRGRLHALCVKMSEVVYCDLHFDRRPHSLFWRVDYRKLPAEFFERVLRKKLERKRVPFRTKQVNWFTRRNRAIFSGVRIQEKD